MVFEEACRGRHRGCLSTCVRRNSLPRGIARETASQLTTPPAQAAPSVTEEQATPAPQTDVAAPPAAAPALAAPPAPSPAPKRAESPAIPAAGQAKPTPSAVSAGARSTSVVAGDRAAAERLNRRQHQHCRHRSSLRLLRLCLRRSNQRRCPHLNPQYRRPRLLRRSPHRHRNQPHQPCRPRSQHQRRRARTNAAAQRSTSTPSRRVDVGTCRSNVPVERAARPHSFAATQSRPRPSSTSLNVFEGRPFRAERELCFRISGDLHEPTRVSHDRRHDPDACERHPDAARAQTAGGRLLYVGASTNNAQGSKGICG